VARDWSLIMLILQLEEMSFVMQICEMEIDGFIIMQNCRNTMDYMRFLEDNRYMIERYVRGRVAGGDGPTYVLPKVAYTRESLDQWVGSTKTAEPNDMAFRGLSHAGSRNNELVG